MTIAKVTVTLNNVAFISTSVYAPAAMLVHSNVHLITRDRRTNWVSKGRIILRGKIIGHFSFLDSKTSDREGRCSGESGEQMENGK
jgi:hypothetical protein